jgi:hypothetical protein
MRRQIIYAGQIPLETDLLNTNRNMMVALSGMAKALFGSSTIVNGLTCTATSPASMQVAIGAGEIYSQANIDDTAYSSLSADTVHQIMKQGITLDAINLSCPAPGTAGQSINYLIEAKFVESDLNPVTLPYYNASNPTSAYSGPANSGAAQPTTRDGTISLIAKAGAAATTGTQTTPAADAGYIGLWVVTVANGATTITSGNIAMLAGAPFVPSGGVVANLTAVTFATRAEGVAGTNTTKAVNCDTMAQATQGGAHTYAVATGTANAIAAALAPAPAALTTGMSIRVKITTTNTGAATLNLNASGAVAIQNAGAALTGGELVSGQIVRFTYDGSVWQAGLSLAFAPVITGQQTSTRLPGGLIMKTGTTNAGAPYSEGTISDSFNVAFPNNCFQVIPVAVNTASNLFKDIWPQRTSISTSGFTFTLQWSGVAGTTNSIDGIDWIAIGN